MYSIEGLHHLKHNYCLEANTDENGKIKILCDMLDAKESSCHVFKEELS